MSEYIYATDEHEGHWLTGEEIVRCRDCRFAIAKGYGCGRGNEEYLDVEPNGFCAWAERKEGGDD